MTDAEDFTRTLLARGIELIVRNGRLRVWPTRAHKFGLSEAERAYIKAHRAKLKALAGTFPEATVVWAPAPPPEPEPVVWTADYARRVTAADVEAAGLRGSTREAYERAREWLAAQQAERDRERRTQEMQYGLRRAQAQRAPVGPTRRF